MDLKHFRYCLSSYDNYPLLREIKWRILSGDKQVRKYIRVIITQVLGQIATYLADKNEIPIVRFLSLRLNKDLVETFSEEYIKMMQRIVLPVMEQIAEIVHRDSQKHTGKQFFEGDTQEISLLGEQFVRMNLECIFIWSKWFPVNEFRLSDFKVVYQRLIHIGVIFPKVTIYDFDSIIKYLPSESVPLDVLRQSKQLIKLGQSTRQVCKNLYLNPKLKTNQSCKTLFRALWKKNNIQHVPPSIKSEITSFTACVLQKNEELNKLVISLQNQTVLLQKENTGRQTIIDCLEQQIITMTKEFQTLRSNQYQQSKLYFDRDLISFEIKQELASLKTTTVKLQTENAFLRQKIEEMRIQTDILQTERYLQQDNSKVVNQKAAPTAELIKTDSLKIIFQQITIIQLRQQLQMIREHISGDRLNQSRESIVMKKEYSQQQTLMSTRNSKQNILSIIEYNPQIFSIYPEALNMNFKQACLINKSILYQDDQLSITVSGNLNKAYLELVLNCNNKSQTPLTNFEIKYNQNPSIQFQQIASKQLEMIPATGTIQQKIQLKYNTIPYQLLEGEIRYVHQNQHYKRYICLPCTINKFFDYQVVQAVLPQSYNYSSKQFATSNLNLLVLLPDFVLRQEEYIARVIFESKQFLIAIRCANSLMQIRICCEPCDKICEIIVSTYQGLFIRRN